MARERSQLEEGEVREGGRTLNSNRNTLETHKMVGTRCLWQATLLEKDLSKLTLPVYKKGIWGQNINNEIEMP